MGNSFKRFLSLALALVMVFAMIPGTVFAAGTGITDEAALINALAAGGEVSLGGDIEATAAITITGEVELDLGGHTLTVPYIVNEGTLAVSNGSIVDTTFDSENNGAIINKGTLTTENVNITGAACVIRSESGTITLDGGTYTLNGVNSTTCNLFRLKGDSALTVESGSFIGARSNTTVNAESSTLISGDNGTTVVINGGDFSYFDVTAMFSGSGEVTIKGGTYNKYGNDWPITIWFDGSRGYSVADGYKYTVSADGKTLTIEAYAAKVGSKYYTSLNDAIKEADDNATITVLEGTHTITGSISKNLTFVGVDKATAIINLGNSANTASGKNLVFENLTLVRPTDAHYVGFHHAASETYTNCIIEGQYWIYATTATFTGCTFNTTDASNYNIWCYGSSVVNFDDCTFNSAGKSVLVYNEGTIAGAKVNVTECEFYASQEAAGKAAIEIDSTLLKNGSYYSIVIDGETKADGFAEGSNSGETLWNNKTNGLGVLSVMNEVTVDGEKVLFLPPNGTVTIGYTNNTSVWGEATANARESLVIEIYEGETKAATTSLNNLNGIIDGDVYVTWSAPFAGSNEGYWNAKWEAGYPNADMKLDKVVLYVDGVKVHENVVQLNGPDNLNKIVASAEKNGQFLGYYTNLTDAMGKFNGRTVYVLRDVTENISGFYGVTLKTDVEGGVTITNTNTDWVDFDDVVLGKGVTANIPNPYSGDSENTILGTLNVSETYYHGYDAKTTIKDGGKVIVDGPYASVILRYNENEDAGLYIYGDGNDETVEFKCSYYIGAYSGTFYAENANIEAGYYLLKNSYDDEDYAGIDLVLNNSDLKTVGTPEDGQCQFTSDDDASITLTNGSSLNVKGVYTTTETVEVSMDETSSIEAANYTMVANYEELVAALAAGKQAVLTDEITATGVIDATNAVIDLNGNKLTLADNANNNFLGTSTIKNGTLSIDGVEVGGDCIIGVGDRSNDATLNLIDVDLVGSDYSSAFAVLMIYGEGTLNITGGEWDLSGEKGSAGGVIKNESGAGSEGTLNITGTTMVMDDITRGISGTTAVLDGVTMTITGGDNGINGTALTVKNSTLTISGGAGRALTVTDNDVTVINSTLNFSDNAEADILYKTANELTADSTSTITQCEVVTNKDGATLNGNTVSGSETDKAVVSVINGVTTIDNQLVLVGEGTQASPYLIRSLEELVLFGENVNAGKFAGKYIYVKLMNDIDTDQMDWTPIGTSANAFQGEFDGNGKTIFHLWIPGTADRSYQYNGFFGKLGNNPEKPAVVKDLTIDGIEMYNCGNRTGAVAGTTFTATMTNVVVKSSDPDNYPVIINSNGTYVGGMVGHGYTTMTNCGFEGSVTGGAQVGGIQGSCYLNATGCYFKGEVYATNYVAGGILGMAQPDGTTTIKECYVEGEVEAASGFYSTNTSGGIVGLGYDPAHIITDNYVNATVSTAGEEVNAPVIGAFNASITNDTDVSTFYGNSWNREKIDTDSFEILEVADDTPQEIIVDRDNNLVVLDSDIPYIDANDAKDVTILNIKGVTEVSEAEVAAKVRLNNKVLFVDANNNGVEDEDEEFYTSLDELFADADLTGDVTVVLVADAAAENYVNVSYTKNIKYNFVTYLEDGAALNFMYSGSSWQQLPKFSVGENVTMNINRLYVIGGDIDVYGTITSNYLYLYGTGEGVTVHEGGVMDVTTSGDKTIQVKGGTELTVNGTVKAGTLNVWTQDPNGSKLVVSGENASAEIGHLHAWSGDSYSVVNQVIVEDGATLDADNFQADRGAVTTVDGATLSTGKASFGYDTNIGTLNVVNGGSVESTGAVSVSANSVINMDASSSITADTLTGTGSIFVDASVYTSGKIVVDADTSAFVGTKEVINNDDAKVVADQDGNFIVVPKVYLEVTIGTGKDYATIEEAVASINMAAYDGITFILCEDMTLDTGIAFYDIKEITIKGEGDVTLTLENNPDDNNYSNPFEATERPTGFSFPDSANYAAEKGSKFTIENLTIVNNKTLDYYGGGHCWRAAYHTYAYAEDVTYTDVDFIGGVAVYANAEFIRCTFTEDRKDYYCLFVDQEYSDADEEYTIVIDECEFRPASTAYGAVKIANKDGEIDLTVADSVFEAVPNKAAINADGNVTATVTGNTFIDCVKGTYKADAPGTVNGVEVTGEDMSAVIDDTNKVTGIGDINGDGILSNADVVIIARYLVDLATLTEDQYYYADVNGDGQIRNNDLVILVRRIVEADKD